MLYADVAGYSRLTEADELGTHRQLAASLDLFAERIRTAGGRVVHYAGDAVLASFESVVAATTCAMGIQGAIAALGAPLPEEKRLRYRIGINLGEVIVDRDDLYGDGVNVAARLESLAEPGGICVSESVHTQVHGRVEADFVDIGERSVKNITRPVRAFHVVPADGAAAPDRASERAARLAAYSKVVAPGDEDVELARRFAHEPPSILILPFRNLGDPERDALVDGFRLTIQSALVKLPGLFLINAPVASLFREGNVSAIQAGAEVGVRYVLEGSVQAAGERVRITAQLTDAAEARVAWAQTFDRTLDDLFAIQDEVSTEVAAELDAALYQGGEMTWWKLMPDRADREQVLSVLSHLYKGTASDTALACGELEDLLARSPDQPYAVALLALATWREAFQGWSVDVEGSLARSAELARRSIELGDADGLGHVVLAAVELHRRRHDEALALSERALRIRYSCPLAFAIRSKVLHFCGRPAEAVEAARRAVRFQRLYPPWMAAVLAAAYRDSGRPSAAIAVASEVLRANLHDLEGRVLLCSSHALAGDAAEARREAEAILRIEPAFSVAGYLDGQPYRDPASAQALGHALRDAGLPD